MFVETPPMSVCKLGDWIDLTVSFEISAPDSCVRDN